jgi:hypothetical protein
MYRWTEYNPKTDAEDRRELVCPDGTLAGVTIRTLKNGWGRYNDRKRADLAQRILEALNASHPHNPPR